jgi:hypothetical protein
MSVSASRLCLYCCSLVSQRLIDQLPHNSHGPLTANRDIQPGCGAFLPIGAELEVRRRVQAKADVLRTAFLTERSLVVLDFASLAR